MIKIADISNLKELVDLALKLWDNHTYDELEKSMKEVLENKNAIIYLYYIENKAIAFAYCQLRFDYVEGTNSSPVGYLEGILVDKNYRKSKIAKSLLKECEIWVKEKGCTELASDCQINNIQSQIFHEKVGFTEANRIICFTKKL